MLQRAFAPVVDRPAPCRLSHLCQGGRDRLGHGAHRGDAMFAILLRSRIAPPSDPGGACRRVRSAHVDDVVLGSNGADRPVSRALLPRRPSAGRRAVVVKVRPWRGRLSRLARSGRAALALRTFETAVQFPIELRRFAGIPITYDSLRTPGQDSPLRPTARYRPSVFTMSRTSRPTLRSASPERVPTDPFNLGRDLSRR